uniref:Uncharacterized protein n=1 Tax=Anguilla anguilla TaxID=7936 RepID=A0A0E9UK50_ANGAN
MCGTERARQLTTEEN